jgi:hypothetical protein
MMIILILLSHLNDLVLSYLEFRVSKLNVVLDHECILPFVFFILTFPLLAWSNIFLIIVTPYAKLDILVFLYGRSINQNEGLCDIVTEIENNEAWRIIRMLLTFFLFLIYNLLSLK